MIDLIPFITFLLYSTVGASARTTFGVYRAYSNYDQFKLSWQRIVIEILASILFGTFGAMLLNEIGVWKIGINITAILAGFFGADIINILTKKLGLAKGIEVRVVEKVEYPDLNLRQQRALEYLKNNEKISSKIYQNINQTTRGTAQWELMQLVQKGHLKKFGKGRGAFYRFIQIDKGKK